MEMAAWWPCSTAQMMFFGPNAASPPKNTFGSVDCMVPLSSFGMSHSSNSMPRSRSTQGKAFSCPTAISTSSHSKVTSGSPVGTSLRLPRASVSARVFSNSMPVSFPLSCRKAFGLSQFKILTPSCSASSFSHGLLHFLVAGAHDHLDVLAAQPARAAAAIHRGVAAAEHDRALADFADMTEIDGCEPVDSEMCFRRDFIPARQFQVAPARRAATDEHRVVVIQQRTQRIDAAIADELHAEIEDVTDFLVDHGFRQAESRHLRAHEASALGVGFEDRDLVSQWREIARDRQ